MPSSRIIISRYLGNPSRTPGLAVDRVISALVNCWSVQFLEKDLPESDLREGAQVLRTTDRGTPVPSHPTRDQSPDHLAPLLLRQVILHARNRSLFLSRSFPTAQQPRTALELLWTRQGRWPSILWLTHISLSLLNTTSPPPSRRSITLRRKINRVVVSRGGSARVTVMVA